MSAENNENNNNENQNNRGRKPKYLTIERFQRFLNNDFFHLQCRVSFNTRLLWIILGSLIAAALIDRLFH